MICSFHLNTNVISERLGGKWTKNSNCGSSIVIHVFNEEPCRNNTIFYSNDFNSQCDHNL